MTPTPPSEAVEVCPACDLVQRRVVLAQRQMARCVRCHNVLATRKTDPIDRSLAIAVSGVILTIAASLLPVLGMRGAGFHLNVSPVETVGALATGGFWPLSALALGLVVIAPLTRFLAMTVVLFQLRRGRPARPWMGRAFRTALFLRPWAMSEVFLVGVMISLIKLGDLVDVQIGLSFWALLGLLVVLVLEHQVLCVNAIWERLEPVK